MVFIVVVLVERPRLFPKVILHVWLCVMGVGNQQQHLPDMFRILDLLELMYQLFCNFLLYSIRLFRLLPLFIWTFLVIIFMVDM